MQVFAHDAPRLFFGTPFLAESLSGVGTATAFTVDAFFVFFTCISACTTVGVVARRIDALRIALDDAAVDRYHAQPLKAYGAIVYLLPAKIGVFARSPEIVEALADARDACGNPITLREAQITDISAGAAVFRVILLQVHAALRACREASILADALAVLACGAVRAFVAAGTAIVGVVLHVYTANAEVGVVIAQTLSLVWTHALAATTGESLFAPVPALAAIVAIGCGD